MTETPKKEVWLNWLALTTVIFSAAATFSSFYGGGYSTRSVVTQTKAADQWAFYQAKSIKQHNFELQKDLMEVEAAARPEAQAQPFRDKITQYEKEIKRYGEEKKEAKAKAEELEGTLESARKHGSRFGLAIVYLQIGIMMSALAALIKKWHLWAVGSLFGALGLLYFANGFWLFF